MNDSNRVEGKYQRGEVAPILYSGVVGALLFLLLAIGVPFMGIIKTEKRSSDASVNARVDEEPSSSPQDLSLTSDSAAEKPSYLKKGYPYRRKYY
jgi:hypothetical protein